MHPAHWILASLLVGNGAAAPSQEKKPGKAEIGEGRQGNRDEHQPFLESTHWEGQGGQRFHASF